MPDELLTVDEAAAMLRKTRNAVYIMIEREQLAGVVRMGRSIRIRRDDLRRSLGLDTVGATTVPRPKG